MNEIPIEDFLFLLNLGTSKNIRFDLEDEEFIQTGLTEIKEKPEGKKNKSKKMCLYSMYFLAFLLIVLTVILIIVLL